MVFFLRKINIIFIFIFVFLFPVFLFHILYIWNIYLHWIFFFFCQTFATNQQHQHHTTDQPTDLMQKKYSKPNKHPTLYKYTLFLNARTTEMKRTLQREKESISVVCIRAGKNSILLLHFSVLFQFKNTAVPPLCF